MRSIDITDTGGLGQLIGDQPVAVRDGARLIAYVVAAGEFAAMQATQSLLATNGAMAAVAEGLADLAAGRHQSWGELRAEHGRDTADDEPVAPAAGAPLVSHRARWDLELLAPTIAQACFDALDAFLVTPDPRPGLRLTAGFPDLRLVVADGYRMVLAPLPASVAVVHVDTPPAIETERGAATG